MAHKKGNIFYDMDGLSAVYNPADYVIGSDGQPIYMTIEHYFANRPEDAKIIRVMEETNTFTNVFVLTRVSNDGRKYLEHVNDKKEWLRAHCPFIDLDTQFIAITDEKAHAVESILGRKLNRHDILVDDYPVNLYDWYDHGGYPVKYLNQFNTFDSRFPGINLPTEMTSDDITELFANLCE